MGLEACVGKCTTRCTNRGLLMSESILLVCQECGNDDDFKVATFVSGRVVFTCEECGAEQWHP